MGDHDLNNITSGIARMDTDKTQVQPEPNQLFAKLNLYTLIGQSNILLK